MKLPFLHISLLALVSTPSIRADWSLVQLHPDGYTSSRVNAGANGQQVGYAVTTSGVTHAARWTGTKASFVDLHPGSPSAYSFCNAISDTDQAGVFVSSSLFQSNAYLWSGSANSAQNLHPAGYASSSINSVSNAIQGGSVSTGGSDIQAGYWSGTAASFTLLHPGGIYVNGSEVTAVAGSKQAGYGKLSSGSRQALLWSGSIESVITLHGPAGLTRPITNSAVYAMTETSQGGIVTFSGSPGGTSGECAAIWFGSADTRVDLHPIGATNSRVYAMVGDFQAGEVDSKATLWQGSVNNRTDLHAVAVQELGDSITRSTVRGAYIESDQLVLVGSVFDSDIEQSLAVMWTQSSSSGGEDPIDPPTEFNVAPTIILDPVETAPRRGSTVTLSATVTGTLPITYQWVALDGQPLPCEQTSTEIVITDFALQNLGRYQLNATNSSGTTPSEIITLSIDSLPPYLANLSGRAAPGIGENTMTAGLAVTNPSFSPFPILFRGVGPSMAPYGVTAFLPDPSLLLFDTGGNKLAQNDNWSSNSDLSVIRDESAKVGAFALIEQSLDAVIHRSVEKDQVTLQLIDVNKETGVGLVEVYRLADDSYSSSPELTNLSLRARTGGGESTAVAGFVITDPLGYSRSSKILLRVVGPTLGDFGIQEPLRDPILKLFNAAGEIIKTVDDWSQESESTEIAMIAAQVGAFPLAPNSADAATVIDLPAGLYSINAGSADDSPGVALLEIYLVR
ncbi:MAG: hypothetical protein SynsKO_01720 [Synoicihabitans sp.]